MNYPALLGEIPFSATCAEQVAAQLQEEGFEAVFFDLPATPEFEKQLNEIFLTSEDIMQVKEFLSAFVHGGPYHNNPYYAKFATLLAQTPKPKLIPLANPQHLELLEKTYEALSSIVYNLSSWSAEQGALEGAEVQDYLDEAMMFARNYHDQATHLATDLISAYKKRRTSVPVTHVLICRSILAKQIENREPELFAGKMIFAVPPYEELREDAFAQTQKEQVTTEKEKKDEAAEAKFAQVGERGYNVLNAILDSAAELKFSEEELRERILNILKE